ncbi:hypothetical protein Tco_0104684 [Tanacetum coccineum]
MMESSTEENNQELKYGTVIYMLVERRYPLSKELLQRMLDLGLEVEEKSTSALHLEKMASVKSWLVQDQTVPVQKQMAFGKDKSNPLIVDSLLKTIRLSIHLVVYNEELAIPEQTTTGKGISNPLMAVPSLMTYLVASLTPDSARSYVRQGASFTQGMVSTIPFVSSISPKGFLPPILLLVVIIAMVVVMIVVVVAVGGIPSILKLSFMVIGFFLGTILLYQESFKFRPGDLIGFFYSNRLGE